MATPSTRSGRLLEPAAKLFRRTGLATRFVLAGVVVTAGIVCGTFVALSGATERSARALFAGELARGARTVAELHRRSLTDLLWTASVTTRNPTLRAAIETHRQEVASPAAAEQLVATIQLEALRTQQDLGKDLLLITDRDGRALAGAGARRLDLAIRPDLSRVPAVRAALDPTASVGAASYSVLEIGGEPYQIGVVPIEMGGFPIGALILGDRLTTTFLDRLRAAFPGRIVVVAGGRALASDAAGRDPLTEQLASGLGGVAADSLSSKTIRVGAEEFAVTSVPLGLDAEGRPVILYLGDSLSDALANLDGALRRSFLWYGLLAIGLVGLAAGAAGRTLVRPLGRFVEFKRSVAASQDYTRRFDASREGPEIRTLADSYDRLIESLERQHRELEASQAQLRQSQKLEAIGTLAGGVAHDFNNLLTVILGHSQALLAEADPASGLAEDLTQIEAAGQRAAGLTKQLLAFSRKQKIQQRVLDLNALVSGIESLLRRLIGEHIELVTSLPSRPTWVTGDVNQLEQVVLNLVVNARDAMPRGGRMGIGIAIRDSDQGGHLGPWVELSVSDSGTGMDPATRERIFEPFFTTKGPGKGTGLGLATVYGIVTQFGGAIDVDTAPGRGSVFRILLPAAVEPLALGPDGDLRPMAGAGQETVLVAEDEEPVRRFAVRVLEQRGYRVLAAANGPEALEKAQAHRGPIPVLITDVVMPGMTGRELFRRLSGSRPAIRVLYMSGYPDEMVSGQGLLEPGVPFLEKPFTAEELARRVRERLDGEVEVTGVLA